MKHIQTLILGAMLLGIIYLLLLTTYNDTQPDQLGEKTKKTLILGYCPTLEDTARQFQNLNKNLEIRKFKNTSVVLDLLNDQKIDLGLVGRKALTVEINPDIVEEALSAEERFTLVGEERATVKYSNLSNYTIYASEKHIDMFPRGTQITQNEQKSDFKLINWEDYRFEHQLIVLVHPDGSKVKEFRSPYLYTRENIKVEYPTISL